MTDIKQKALALLNAVRAERGLDNTHFFDRDFADVEALCRAIEAHEATEQEFSDYKQKVSDAVKKAVDDMKVWSDENDEAEYLQQFIIPAPKPDPLVDVAKSLGFNNTAAKNWAGGVRAKLDARGLKIVEKNDD